MVAMAGGQILELAVVRVFWVAMRYPPSPDHISRLSDTVRSLSYTMDEDSAQAMKGTPGSSGKLVAAFPGKPEQV